jgi:hypothetical protein
MNIIDQLFSTRAWNRLVINVLPGIIFLTLLGVFNRNANEFYKSIANAYVQDRTLIWPILLVILLLSLCIGLMAEECGGFIEGAVYDVLTAKRVSKTDTNDETCPKNAGNEIFECVWNQYLLTKVDTELPFASFYRNRLVGYKFLLSSHVVVFSVLVILLALPSSIEGSVACSAIILFSALVLIILRIYNVALSLHEYRTLIIRHVISGPASLSR